MLLYALARVFLALVGVAAAVCVAFTVAAALVLALPVAAVIYWATGRWVLA